MKKILLTTVLALFAVSAVMAEDMPKKPSFKGFVTNGFWDNWEISLGAGVATAFSSGDNYGTAGDRIGWELNGALTKWFNPVVGLRGQLMAGQYKNIIEGTNTAAKWKYIFAHADVMVNFSNWVGGYREDRVYYAVPFAGGGLIASDVREQFAVTAGLLNKFRVSKAWDINLELKAVLAESYLASTGFNGRAFGALSATVGATYRFGKRDFVRNNPYTAADLKVYQDAADASKAASDAAQAEAARLAEQLKNTQAEYEALKNAPPTIIYQSKEAPVTADSPTASIVVYEIGVSTLNNREKIRLDLIALLIKKGPKDDVYAITGHADYSTGSKATNERIALRRAKSVYDYLIKCGVPAEQLTYEGRGEVDETIASKPEANRVAIIKKADKK